MLIAFEIFVTLKFLSNPSEFFFNTNSLITTVLLCCYSFCKYEFVVVASYLTNQPQ